jgi:CheY-like chemotaxis protein
MAKILLIDDDVALQQFLQEALQRIGHEVHPLERAEGGVDILATGEFDLVLVDQHMPGLSGTDFLKVLRKKEIATPAILMTGFATGTIKETVEKLGVVFVVPKPAGGHEEFWKELQSPLTQALKGEAEIVASMRRAIDAAIKAGKTNLVAWLRKILDEQLLTRTLALVGEEEAARILGVPLAQLLNPEPAPAGSRSKARALSLVAEALLLIHNHPEWTALEYAKKLGCSKAKLYKNPIINGALKERNAGNRPPSGYKDADGDIEAYD